MMNYDKMFCLNMCAWKLTYTIDYFIFNKKEFVKDVEDYVRKLGCEVECMILGDFLQQKVVINVFYDKKYGKNRIYSISEKIEEHMKILKNENMIIEQMY